MEQQVLWHNQVEFIGYTYVIPVICAVGFVLNLLTFIVLMDRMFQKATFLLLKVLALADAVTLIVTLPFGPVYCDTCPHTQGGLSRLVYLVYIYPPVTNTSETISAWIIIALGCERLYAMRYWSNQSFGALSNKRGQLIAAAIVGSAIILNLPFFFCMKIVNDQRMMTEFGLSHGFVVYSWLRAVLVQFLPLLVLCVLNTVLLVWLGHWRQQGSHMAVWCTGARRQRAQSRLTAMLLATIFLFILSNIPVAFAYCPIFWSLVDSGQHNAPQLFTTYRFITHCLALTAYSLDFVVYCLSNSHFRFAAADILCHRCRARRQVQPMPSTVQDVKNDLAVQDVTMSHHPREDAGLHRTDTQLSVPDKIVFPINMDWHFVSTSVTTINT